MDEKSFLEKYAHPSFLLKKGQKSNLLTDDIPQSPDEFLVYHFKKAVEAIELVVDLVIDPENTISTPDYLQFKLKEINQQKGIQQEQTENHDTRILKEKNISPIELNKMKHRFLQSSISLNKQIKEAVPDLPRTEKGHIDFEKCSDKQKKAVTQTVATFVNKNPEYKKMLENILQRKISSDEVKRDAMGLSATYATNQKRSGR